MKTKLNLISTGLLLLFTVSLSAQKGIVDGSKYGHGQDSIDCRMNASLFYEAAKQKSYADAVAPWTHCYENCPQSTSNIYYYGVQIVEWQIKTAKTEEDKEKYINKLMEVYDQRIKYFGTSKKYPEAYILGEKASSLYEYKKDPASLRKAYDWYTTSINKLGQDSKATNLQNFIAINYELFNISEIVAEELLNNYELVQSIFEMQLKASTDPTTQDLLKQIIDANVNNISRTGVLDCEKMETIFGPKIENNKADIEYLNKSLAFFEKAGCTENESYYKASEYIHAISPSSASAAGIAGSYIKRNEIDEALKYFAEAISLETDVVKKAKYYYTVALLQFTKKNDFEAARKYCLLALKENPNWGDPYILIGDLYAQSAQKQMLGKKDIENQAGYWAATDKYAMAKKVDPAAAEKASNMIKLYSNYFPNKEIIFFEPDYEQGKTITVGGWIQEKTVVRAKE